MSTTIECVTTSHVLWKSIDITVLVSSGRAPNTTRLSMSWVVLYWYQWTCAYIVSMYGILYCYQWICVCIVPRVVELYSTTVLWLMHDHCLEHLYLQLGPLPITTCTWTLALQAQHHAGVHLLPNIELRSGFADVSGLIFPGCWSCCCLQVSESLGLRLEWVCLATRQVPPTVLIWASLRHEVWGWFCALE